MASKWPPSPLGLTPAGQSPNFEHCDVGSDKDSDRRPRDATRVLAKRDRWETIEEFYEPIMCEPRRSVRHLMAPAPIGLLHHWIEQFCSAGFCARSTELAEGSRINTATTMPEINVRPAIEAIAAESPNLSAMMPADSAPIA